MSFAWRQSDRGISYDLPGAMFVGSVTGPDCLEGSRTPQGNPDRRVRRTRGSAVALQTSEPILSCGQVTPLLTTKSFAPVHSVLDHLHYFHHVELC